MLTQHHYPIFDRLKKIYKTQSTNRCFKTSLFTEKAFVGDKKVRWLPKDIETFPLNV